MPIKDKNTSAFVFNVDMSNYSCKFCVKQIIKRFKLQNEQQDERYIRIKTKSM